MTNLNSLFLSQAYKDCWDDYNRSLKLRSFPRWDYVILTASNEQQAEGFRKQIADRQNFLPRGTKFIAIPDRDGRRVGSGGATLEVLRYLHEQEGSFDSLRVLVIHSGGDSKRVPQYSALGKLFSPVPHELPNGRSSTLFDEFMICMSSVPSRIREGMKRARYNSSLIDANVTEPGEQYQNLNETYVVFITENDVLGENIPIYHVDRIVRETGKMFNDQSHIIYVNSQIKDETALGKLMHDFTCTNAKDMYYEVLADRVHYFKEDEKGVAIMCKAMEDMRNEAAREAEKMKAIRMARLMIEDGKLNYEDIAMYTELTLEEVEKIALEKKSA